MRFTPRGIVTVFRLEHLLNAKLPIFVTLFGIATDVNPEQFKNAFSSMLVTVLGMLQAPCSVPVYPVKTPFSITSS